MLIEVKLNSVKSSLGDDDQLATYLDLLDDRMALEEWNHPGDHRYLIYLTQIFANLELEDSIRISKDPAAVTRMFGLEWRDILEAAQAYSLNNDLLREVALFLRQRGFESFRGMRSPGLSSVTPRGPFYSSDYFTSRRELTAPTGVIQGAFYGR